MNRFIALVYRLASNVPRRRGDEPLPSEVLIYRY